MGGGQGGGIERPDMCKIAFKFLRLPGLEDLRRNLGWRRRHSCHDPAGGAAKDGAGGGVNERVVCYKPIY